MARLIKTEKEVEGRYTETWIVVEEDALEQWPEGPLETVGRDVPRVDGEGRARGQAPYTADLQLPGMLHTAVLRSPHARARVTSIDLAPARSEPGVRGAIGHTLRVMAQENRDMRMNEAEKKAAALPPKLTVPMILFFLPVLFIVILGPAAIRVMEIK